MSIIYNYLNNSIKHIVLYPLSTIPQFSRPWRVHLFIHLTQYCLIGRYWIWSMSFMPWELHCMLRVYCFEGCLWKSKVVQWNWPWISHVFLCHRIMSFLITLTGRLMEPFPLPHWGRNLECLHVIWGVELIAGLYFMILLSFFLTY